MRRYVFVVVAVLVVVGAGIGVFALREPSVIAQDERTIPVHVMSFRDNADRGLTGGDACSWTLPTLSVVNASPQLLVRNETGTIVAQSNLNTGTIDMIEGKAFCIQDVVLTVPDGEYFTLYLAGSEEKRIQGFAATDFPIDAVNKISIDPDFT